MLLVMSTSGVLVDPQGDPQSHHAVLWTATWAAVHAFSPDLQQELFPDESTSAAAQPSAAQENGAQEAREAGTREEQPQSS